RARRRRGEDAKQRHCERGLEKSAAMHGGFSFALLRLGYHCVTRSVCSPPPCGEGLGVGVAVIALDRRIHASKRMLDVVLMYHRAPTWTPTPSPSPQGGGEHTERTSSSYINFTVCCSFNESPARRCRPCRRGSRSRSLRRPGRYGSRTWRHSR